MIEPEHISTILTRVFVQLMNTWNENKEEEQVEIFNQKSPVESSAV